MKKISTIAIIACTVSSSLFAQNNGSISLATGKKYTIENKVNTTSSSEMQGQQMETTADVSTTYSIEVKGLKDDKYNMTNSISSIKLNMSSMGQNMNFDSEKKEDMAGEMGSSFKDIINQPNNVVMDRSGKVIVAPKKDTAKAASANPTAMIMKQMGDPEQQGYGAIMAFLAVPKKAKAGDTWKDSTSAEGVTRVTNYTIKNIKDKVATVAIDGTEKRDTKMEMQGMEINTKTDGKISGEETVDASTGIIMQSNTTLDAKGTVYVMGQEVPTTAKAVSVTTVRAL